MHRPAAVQSPTLAPAAEVAFAAPALVAAVAVAWAAIRGIDHSFISFSDGVYMYAASEGAHALYSVVAVALPPAPLLLTAAIWKASPHIETIRLALAFAGAVTALLTYLVARRLFALGPWAAALAAIVALTAPIHAQFVGVDGELLLTPLVLALALALDGRRRALAVVLLGAGFFCKLTWAPFFLAGIVVLWRRDGRRAAVTAAIASLAVGGALYVGAMAAFDWSAHDLLSQLVLAESNSGFQFDLLLGLVAVVVVLWWPFVALGRAGLTQTNEVSRLLLAAGAVGTLSMLKQGTFFNVLDPLEPLLATVAVAGGVALWRRRRYAVVVVCALGVAVHVASVSSGALRQALPVPVGAALVNTHNEDEVDRIAAAVAASSRPDQPVLVNPLFALVAERREVQHAADWFILHALDDGRWERAKRARVAVVSVDSNVVSFDPAFKAHGMRRVLRVDAPPIETTIYAR
jgi:uncharacterized membrane protein